MNMGRTESSAIIGVKNTKNLISDVNYHSAKLRENLYRVTLSSDSKLKLETVVKRLTKQIESTGFIYNIYDSDHISFEFYNIGKKKSFIIRSRSFEPITKRSFPKDFIDFFDLEQDDIKLVRQIVKLNEPESIYVNLEHLANIDFSEIRENMTQLDFLPKKKLIQNIKEEIQKEKVKKLKVVDSYTLSAKCGHHQLDDLILIFQKENFNKYSAKEFELYRVTDNIKPEIVIPKQIFSFHENDQLFQYNDFIYVWRESYPLQTFDKETNRVLLIERDPSHLFKIDLVSKTVIELSFESKKAFTNSIKKDLKIPYEDDLESNGVKWCMRSNNTESLEKINFDSYIDKFKVLDDKNNVIGKVVMKGVNILNYFDSKKYLRMVNVQEKNEYITDENGNINDMNCLFYLHFLKVLIPGITQGNKKN